MPIVICIYSRFSFDNKMKILIYRSIIRVTQCTDVLPKDKPRYCMGVGYAEDLVVCCALGVDMYDCVYPTRTAVSIN